MSKTRGHLFLEYGGAIVIAPLLCWGYRHFLGRSAEEFIGLVEEGKRLFFLVIFYPLIEELTFRGVIQESLDSLTQGYKVWGGVLSLSNLFTSLLFASMHLLHHGLWWACAVFFPSLLFGYFKDSFHTVYASIFLHSYYNFIFFSIVER